MTQRQTKIYNHYVNHPDATIKEIAKRCKSNERYVAKCIEIGLSYTEAVIDIEQDVVFDIELEIADYEIIDYRLPFLETYQTK